MIISDSTLRERLYTSYYSQVPFYPLSTLERQCLCVPLVDLVLSIVPRSCLPIA